MSDDLRHNMNLVIPGLNFWGDQNDAVKSVVDKTKWVMETAINRIEKLEEQIHYANGVADLAMKHRDYAEQRVEKLEAALRSIIVHCEVPAPPNAEALKMFARKALEVPK